GGGRPAARARGDEDAERDPRHAAGRRGERGGSGGGDGRGRRGLGIYPVGQNLTGRSDSRNWSKLQKSRSRSYSSRNDIRLISFRNRDLPYAPLRCSAGSDI